MLAEIVGSRAVFDFVFGMPAQSVIWLINTAAAILFLWRNRGWPESLILIGCVGNLITMSFSALYMYTLKFPLASIPPDGCEYRHWSLCLLAALSPFAVLCLPLGVLWLAIRVTRRI
jgi:hypothetical protein